MDDDNPENEAEALGSQSYDRVAFAIFALIWTLASIVGGLCLFWWRRHQPLLARRSFWHAVVLALCMFLLLEVPYREYYGKVACPVHFTIVYVLAAVLPAVLTLRFVEITARHALQSEELNSSFGSYLEDLPAATSTPQPGSFLYIVDRFLLRFRLQSFVPRLVLLAAWVSPWIVYFIYQVTRNKPRLNSLSNFSCVYHVSDLSMFAASSLCYALFLSPLYARLWFAPDSLGLRLELVIQFLFWPPLVILLLVGKFIRAFDAINGEYGVLLGCNLTFILSVWAPCIASFNRAKQDAPRDVTDESNAEETLLMAEESPDAVTTRPERSGGLPPRVPSVTFAPGTRGSPTLPPRRESRGPLFGATSNPATTPGAGVPIVPPLVRTPSIGQWFSSSMRSLSGALGIPVQEAAAASAGGTQQRAGALAHAEADAAVVFQIEGPEIVHPDTSGRPPLSPMEPVAKRALFRGQRQGQLSSPEDVLPTKRSIMGVPLESSLKRSFRELNVVPGSSAAGGSQRRLSGAARPRHSFAAMAAAAASALADPFDALSRHKLVLPLPSRTELLDVLTQRPRDVLNSPRSLRIIGALLFVTAPGIAVLREVLRREFCVELQNFGLEAMALLQSCRNALCAMDRRRQWASPKDALPLEDEEDGAGSASGEPVFLDFAAPDFPSHADLASLLERTQTVVTRYIGHGAPMSINVSDKCASKLLAACEALRAAMHSSDSDRSASPPSDEPPGSGARRMADVGYTGLYVSDLSAGSLEDTEKPCRAALGLLAASLRVAKLDVLLLMVRGPVFRWLQHDPAHYTQWATALLRDAAFSILRGTEGAADSQKPPSPRRASTPFLPTSASVAMGTPGLMGGGAMAHRRGSVPVRSNVQPTPSNGLATKSTPVVPIRSGILRTAKEGEGNRTPADGEGVRRSPPATHVTISTIPAIAAPAPYAPAAIAPVHLPATPAPSGLPTAASGGKGSSSGVSSSAPPSRSLRRARMRHTATAAVTASASGGAAQTSPAPAQATLDRSPGLPLRVAGLGGMLASTTSI